MLKKNAKIVWGTEAKKAFQDIKDAISSAPVLTSPYYKRPFYLYTFAFDHSLAGVLTQRNEEDQEKPIAFMSAPLKDAELRYPILDKQAFALVRTTMKFRHYILRSEIIAIVSDSAVKNLLAQYELGDKRGNWVYALLEYDLTVQPMKIVRG